MKGVLLLESNEGKERQGVSKATQLAAIQLRLCEQRRLHVTALLHGKPALVDEAREDKDDDDDDYEEEEADNKLLPRCSLKLTRQDRMWFGQDARNASLASYQGELVS